MPTGILRKSFDLCISKLKCFPTVDFSPPSAIDEQDEDQKVKNFNFNSLHDGRHSEISTSKSLFSSENEDSDLESLPDFTSAVASHRLFFSSPGSSNSILESGTMVGGGVAVHTYSPDPYSDFRKSMLEMIVDRGMPDVEVDWVFLHELLLCYLTLNSQHNHRFIIDAFADVVISLFEPLPTWCCLPENPSV